MKLLFVLALGFAGNAMACTVNVNCFAEPMVVKAADCSMGVDCYAPIVLKAADCSTNVDC